MAKKPKTTEPFPTLPIVLITWDDAASDTEQARDLIGLCLVTTVGFLQAEDEDAFHLVTDIDGSEYRCRHRIPKGMVKSFYFLEP